MKPIDFRNATFDEIRDQLQARRLEVYEAWLQHGPGTTRQVAERAGIDILSFRPRTTELYQLGFVCLTDDYGAIGNDLPGEGTYRARTEAETLAHFTATQRNLTEPQLPLL